MPFSGGYRRWFGGSRPAPFRSAGWRSNRGPSAAKILLAGLAVFALVRLMSSDSHRSRTTAEKVMIGALVGVLGALLLSLRRSTMRYRWS